MRAAIFRGPGLPVAIETVPDPDPAEDGVVIRVHRCGICGSDLSLTEGGPFGFAAGTRLGHEYCGEVVAVGRLVDDLKPGDVVAAIPSLGCGHCPTCRDGRPLFCAGFQPLFGGFADYVAVPRRNAVKLSPGLSFADGALIEPFACGLHALRRAGFARGDHVLVIGAGAMASGVIYWARRLGAGQIAVMSRSAARADAAIALGADAVIDHDVGATELLDRFGRQPDVVAECVGKEGFVGKAVDAVRPGGTVISMGCCMRPEPILPAGLSFRDLRLVFPIAYSNDEFVETARAFERSEASPQATVGEVVPLSTLPVRLEALRRHGAPHKIHVNPQAEAIDA